MSDVVIKVDNLSKEYIISHQRQERSAMNNIYAADINTDTNTDMNTYDQRIFSSATSAEEKLIFCLPFRLSVVCG